MEMFVGSCPAQAAQAVVEVGGGGEGCSTFSSSSSSSKARTERLWKDYFRDPSQWWDKRKSKTNPKAPDFKHKLSKESLWMDGWNNPSWVQHMLRGGERVKESFVKEGLHKPQEDVHNNTITSGDSGGGCGSGGWEMLSLDKALPSLEEALLPRPSIEDISCVLRKCRKEREHAYAYALRLHAYMRKHGLETHPLLGNQLVLMLVEVGSMSEAQQVFDKLVCRKDRTWNSLITGYVGYGKSHHALILYQKMQEDCSAHPNSYTFVALLKACAELKDLESGRRIHTDIARSGLLERDVVVGNAVVSMYIKCRSLVKAQEVFDNLPVQNVVSWNTLIAGYAKHGRGEEALKCFERMQHEGISPNAVTFVCSLKACGSIGDMDKGQEIHVEIARKGLLETDLHVGSILVDMYAKGGFLTIAQEVFDKLPARNVVSWNALIAGYAQHGCGEQALNCFERMQLEGVSPDAVTFICVLKACGSIRATDKGGEIHAQIARNGLLERDLVVGSALVNMYAKCGLFAKAQEVLDKLPSRDVVSWTALIAGYAEHGHGEEALNCFERMQLEGISPNAVTFVCSLKACGSIGATDKGQDIHAEIARKGLLDRDPILGSTLVDMYAKCGLLAKAQEVFDKLPARNVVSWNALITGYVQYGCGEEALNCFERMQLEAVSPDAVTFVCSLKACSSIGATDKGRKIHAQIAREGLLGRYLAADNALVDMYAKCGLLTKAQEVFDELPNRDIVSWNALIAGYAQHECGEEALNCFEQMQLEGFNPDVVTFVCSLKACGSIGATAKGQEIHAEIARDGGLSETDPAFGNALVDMYAKCGLLTKAQEVFDKLLVRDLVSWTALIAGYAQLGESENVFHIFGKMIGEGIKPNLVTFVSVLNACSHTGLVDKGQAYFEAMSKEYDIIPISEHYTCMVDLLCRAGQLEKAVAMIKKMHFLPDLVVWHTVLGACRKWSNVELGRQAFEHAVRLDEKDPAAYVCMSNIYANAGMQEDAKMVEALRLEKQAWKKPGHCWWTDDSGVVHSFLLGDKKHYLGKNIYAKLEGLSLKMREEGLNWVPQDMYNDAKEDVLCGHNEKLAVACALISTPKGTPIHVVKNMRVCNDCHEAMALVSNIEQRRILVKDAIRFHFFEEGNCACTDNW